MCWMFALHRTDVGASGTPVRSICLLCCVDYTDNLTETYIAFCRNYGNHYTKAQGGHDWNAEANDQMVRDLKIPWYQLQEYFKRQQRDVEASIKEMTASAVTYLGRFTSSQRLRA